MAAKLLESGAISAFCGSIATMLSAGMQVDEAVHLLSENNRGSHFKMVCDQVYRQLITGSTLSAAMASTKAFPHHVVDMVRTGEQSGRAEGVLRSLDVYYSEEERTFQKIRTSVSYPAALLCIMAIILAVTVIVILPIFTSVYENMAGSLTAASSGTTVASIVIGWIAFGITVICAILAMILAFMSRSQTGRERVLSFFSVLPPTRVAMYQLALSRFCAALSTYLAAGITSETALWLAIDSVNHTKLKARLIRSLRAMEDVTNPRSLTQAIVENEVLDPLYAHMLTVGSSVGNTDEVLMSMSEVLFDDATMQLDRALDRIEPLLAALLTIAVGATLISVMLPLIGIMGSIG